MERQIVESDGHLKDQAETMIICWIHKWDICIGRDELKYQ